MKITLTESPNCFRTSSTSPFSNAGGSGSFFVGGAGVVDFFGRLVVVVVLAAGAGGVAGGFDADLDGAVGGVAELFVLLFEVPAVAVVLVAEGFDGEVAVVADFLDSSLLLLAMPTLSLTF
jgi:hypothetical protein